ADDEVHRHDVVRRFLGGGLEVLGGRECIECAASDLLAGGRDTGQVRRDRPRERDVVEGDHAQLLRHVHTSALGTVEQTERHQVVVDHDGGHCGGEHDVRCRYPTGEVRLERTEITAAYAVQLGNDLQEPALPGGVRPGVARPADVPDLGVPERPQMPQRLDHAVPVVWHHGGDCGHGAVHQHHRGTAGGREKLLGAGAGRTAQHAVHLGG